MTAKGSKNRPTKATNLLSERNRIRGLIGASKSRRVALDPRSRRDKAEKDRAFQRGLAAALIQAREKIASSQFDAFLTWLEIQTSSLLADFHSYNTSSEVVSEAIHAKPLPLHKEILWVASRLLQHGPTLAEYVKQKRELELLYWSPAEWLEVEERLEAMERQFGRNLWVLEARIALEQQFLGLEHQKRTAKRERQLANKGITAFFAHYVSVRNEPTTFYKRFRSDLDARLNEEKQTALIDFLRFRMLASESTDRLRLARVLQVGQSLSEIDLYETLIGVCQLLCAGASDVQDREAIAVAADKLTSIPDPRIAKLLLLSGKGELAWALPPRDLTACDLALEQHGYHVLRTCILNLEKEPLDFKAAVLAAAQVAGPPTRPDSRRGRRWTSATRKLATVLSFGPTYETDLDAVEKLFRNFSFFPSAVGCWASFSADLESAGAISLPLRKLAALNSPYLDPDELSLVSPELAREYVDRLSEYHSESPTLKWCEAGLVQEVPQARCRPFQSNLVSEVEGVLTDMTELGHSDTTRKPKWQRTFAALSSLHAEMYQGNISSVVGLLASLYLEEEVPLPVIPIEAAIGHLRWRQLASSKGDLSLPIALHLFWRSTNTEQAATHVRFAFDEFLESRGVTSATALGEQRKELDERQLTYFLRHVCVPSVLDMNRHIATSREAEAERRRICSLLCELILLIVRRMSMKLSVWSMQRHWKTASRS